MILLKEAERFLFRLFFISSIREIFIHYQLTYNFIFSVGHTDFGPVSTDIRPLFFNCGYSSTF